MKEKIFVTGGAGFIGSNVIHKLAYLGYETASFDANLNFINNDLYYEKCITHRKKIYNSASKIYYGDIRKKRDLASAVADFKPNIIVHLAGIPTARPLKKYRNLMVEFNLLGTLNTLEIFEKSSAAKFVYTSSSMAYGHFRQFPQSEQSILNTTNSYGACKAASEYFIGLSKKDWVIVRPTSVYGFADCANRVSQLILDAAYLKRNIWVVKGETLDFSYIDDVVDGFVSAITTNEANGHIFNISRGEARQTQEFAEIVKKYFPDFTYEIRDPDLQQVSRGPLDISKAKEILNFNPQYSIEKGVEKIIQQNQEYNFYSTLY